MLLLHAEQVESYQAELAGTRGVGVVLAIYFAEQRAEVRFVQNYARAYGSSLVEEGTVVVRGRSGFPHPSTRTWQFGDDRYEDLEGTVDGRLTRMLITGLIAGFVLGRKSNAALEAAAASQESSSAEADIEAIRNSGVGRGVRSFLSKRGQSEAQKRRARLPPGW
jgi:hypothetical protein